MSDSKKFSPETFFDRGAEGANKVMTAPAPDPKEAQKPEPANEAAKFRPAGPVEKLLNPTASAETDPNKTKIGEAEQPQPGGTGKEAEDMAKKTATAGAQLPESAKIDPSGTQFREQGEAGNLKPAGKAEVPAASTPSEKPRDNREDGEKGQLNMKPGQAADIKVDWTVHDESKIADKFRESGEGGKVKPAVAIKDPSEAMKSESPAEFREQGPKAEGHQKQFSMDFKRYAPEDVAAVVNAAIDCAVLDIKTAAFRSAVNVWDSPLGDALGILLTAKLRGTHGLSVPNQETYVTASYGGWKKTVEASVADKIASLGEDAAPYTAWLGRKAEAAVAPVQVKTASAVVTVSDGSELVKDLSETEKNEVSTKTSGLF